MIDEWHYESEKIKIDRVKDDIKYLIKGDAKMEGDYSCLDYSYLKSLESKKESAIIELEEFERFIKENDYEEDELIRFNYYRGDKREIHDELTESIKLWEERIVEWKENEIKRMEEEKKKEEQRKRYEYLLTKINYNANVINDQMDIFDFI